MIARSDIRVDASHCGLLESRTTHASIRSRAKLYDRVTRETTAVIDVRPICQLPGANGRRSDLRSHLVKTLPVVVVLLLGVASRSSGQIRGLGFVQGTIVDEKGAPVPDVKCLAHLPRVGDKLAATSNRKGEWKFIGMSHGEWDITCDKPGYVRGAAKLVLETELSRVASVTIKMMKAIP